MCLVVEHLSRVFYKLKFYHHHYHYHYHNYLLPWIYAFKRLLDYFSNSNFINVINGICCNSKLITYLPAVKLQ